jgi:alkylation response protein AidB-like acyl-CoA dehydrogenase
MEFQFTEEQLMVRDAARQFAEERIKPIAKEIDREHMYPTEVVKELGEMGFMGVAVPEEWGGSGMDYVTYVLVVEEISRVCASTGIIVSVNNSLACHPVLTFGTDEQKEKFLKPMASGEKLGALTMTEPSAGSDPSSIQTVMKDDGDHWIVNGTKNFCTNGREADFLIFLGYTDKDLGNKGLTTLIVEKDTPGFTLGKMEDKLGIRGSSTAELIFENCRIPKTNTLGEVNKGFKTCMVTLDAGRIGVASQALGIALASIEDAVEFSKQRVQFGKPISANEAIQWMLADMAVEYESAKLLTLRAAWMKDQGQRYSREAAMAKLKASEASVFCADRSLQVHGGYGYTSDYNVERYFRDARITPIYEGTNEVMRMVIARSALS